MQNFLFSEELHLNLQSEKSCLIPTIYISQKMEQAVVQKMRAKIARSKYGEVFMVSSFPNLMRKWL